MAKNYTGNGVNSPSFINALAKAKRDSGKYSFYENIENVVIGYWLNEEEEKALVEKLFKYYDKNGIYRPMKYEMLIR